VIIADTRGSMVAGKLPAVIGCVFDFDDDSGPMLAQRALSDGVASTPLSSAR
jgi:hypothetical protein